MLILGDSGVGKSSNYCYFEISKKKTFPFSFRYLATFHRFDFNTFQLAVVNFFFVNFRWFFFNLLLLRIDDEFDEDLPCTIGKNI